LAYHDDLLRQARELARKDRGRPRQVNLRRAVSSAYYAAFHLLSDEGAATLSPSQPEPAAAQVRRAFNHQDMRVICANFSVWNRKHDHPKNGLPAWALRLLTFPLNSSLVSVCDLFVDLQAARHTADYDVSYNWSRSEALENVDDAGQIFAEWRKVRKQPNNPRRVRYRVWV
jgi:uncharacterized protein (UPF0332 family)